MAMSKRDKERAFKRFLEGMTSKGMVSKKLRNFHYNEKGFRLGNPVMPCDEVTIHLESREGDPVKGIVLDVSDYISIESPRGSGKVVAIHEMYIVKIVIHKRHHKLCKLFAESILGDLDDDDDGGITQ